MMKLYLALMTAYVIAVCVAVYLAAPTVSGWMEKFDQIYWGLR